ncbi:MAG: MFS transporter [Firmicutes bacterium]|nr:MFS transporter [Alicyclobacillaceae bacterium]MCL6496610.1 MFS transporter [Bacillota bacterium]
MGRGMGGRAMALLGVIALYWMSLYLYVPVFGPDMVRNGSGYGWVGLAVAAYGLPQLTLRAWLGIWADGSGHLKPFLAVALGMAAVSSAVMGAFPLAWVFVLGRLLAGVAASFWAMFSTLYVNEYGAGGARPALGWVSFANSGGQVLAALLGGWMAQLWGWQVPFWAAAVTAGVGLALLAAVHERGRRGSGEGEAAPKAVSLLRATPSLRLAAGLGIFSQVATFVLPFGFLPVWAYHLGFSRSALGVLTMVGQIPATLVNLLAAGRWVSRWPLERVSLAGLVLALVACAAMPWVRAPWGLLALQAVFGAGRGILSPTLMAMAIQEVAARVRTTAMAVYQASYALGMVGGPLLAGWAVGRFGLGSAFAIAGGALALGVGMALRRPKPASSAAPEARPRP